MRSQLIARVAAIAVVLGGVTAGVVTAAPSALAIPIGCTGSAMEYSNYGVLTSPPEVYSISYWYWNGCTDEILNPVAIYKDVSGTWEEVAEGTGTVTYSCTGGTALYKVTPDGADFSCG